MTYELYTQGSAELMASILNGVAMLTSGGKSGFIAQIGVTLGTAVAFAYAGARNDPMHMFKYFAYYTTVVSFLLVPTATIVVHDTITENKYPVAGLPWSFVFGVGNISKASHALTTQFESVFRTPDDFSYQRSGMVFGSRIISDLKDVKVNDATFQANINSFVDQCLVNDIAIGGKYTLGDLVKTDNIWGLLRTHAREGLFFSYLNSITKKRTLLSCKEGLAEMESQWPEIINKTTGYLSKKYYGNVSSDTAKQLFLSNLDVANRLLIRSSVDQTGILKQKILINAL